MEALATLFWYGAEIEIAWRISRAIGIPQRLFFSLRNASFAGRVEFKSERMYTE